MGVRRLPPSREPCILAAAAATATQPTCSQRRPSPSLDQSFLELQLRAWGGRSTRRAGELAAGAGRRAGTPGEPPAHAALHRIKLLEVGAAKAPAHAASLQAPSFRHRMHAPAAAGLGVGGHRVAGVAHNGALGLQGWEARLGGSGRGAVSTGGRGRRTTAAVACCSPPAALAPAALLPAHLVVLLAPVLVAPVVLGVAAGRRKRGEGGMAGRVGHIGAAQCGSARRVDPPCLARTRSQLPLLSAALSAAACRGLATRACPQALLHAQKARLQQQRLTTCSATWCRARRCRRSSPRAWCTGPHSSSCRRRRCSCPCSRSCVRLWCWKGGRR